MADIKVNMTDENGAKVKKPHKGSENLISFKDMTPEQHAKLSSAGGKKAAENRKCRATFKEALQWALELPAMNGNPTVSKLRKKFPGMNNRDAMVISMITEAINKGNVKAFEVVRDTVGESPKQNISLGDDGGITINIKTVE